MLKALKNPILSFLALALVGVGAHFALDSFIQLMIILLMINMILALSLNLVNGYTGQFSLGHAGFMAVGAYFSAFLSTKIPLFPAPFELINFGVFAFMGGMLAAGAGFVVGQPSLRLKGDYLAIVTLGFSEIIRVILLTTESVGGARGMYGIPGPSEPKFLQIFLMAAFWLLVSYFVIWRLIRSTHGRAFLSVREDEIAAEAMGVNTTKTKVRAFVLSSFFAGVAGSLFAHSTNYLNLSSFTFQRSVDAVIMVVLGGMGSMSGSILAAVFITVTPEALRPLQDLTGVDLRMVIYALCLILLMILRPKGLFGNKEITDYVRKSA